jgi:glycogen synthase
VKIGLVSREYPPFFGGGVGTYVHQVSRALAAAGHEVHVFTVRTGPEDRSADPPGVQVHRAPFDPQPASRSGFTGPWVMANRWFHAALLFRDQLLEFTAEHRLDIVEFPEWEAPGWLTLLDWRWDTPSVVNCHTPTWLLQQLNGQPPLAGQVFENLETALVEAVCAPCGPMARRVEAAMAPETVTVVHHPFFADDVDADPQPARGKHMLYVGRLELRKGVIELIDAAAHVLDEEPEAELTLVGGDTTTRPGGGPMKELLEARVAPRHRDRVHFIDNAPSAELYAFYRRAAFCVFPSRFENFPNVCLEAMAAGRTAIVGNDSGMVEMIGEAGVTTPPENPAALAEAMLGLLRDPARVEELGRQAARRAREIFAPAKMAAARVAYYEQVIAASGERSALAARLARVPEDVWRQVAPDQATAFRILLAGKLEGAAHQNIVVERLLRKVALKLNNRPQVRIALYGAGQHTQQLAPFFDLLTDKGVAVALIVDDNPARHGDRIGNVEIVAPSAAIGVVDAVVLSSDAAETALWTKSATLREAGLPVVRLYALED